jgi:hypothetical protein
MIKKTQSSLTPGRLYSWQRPQIARTPEIKLIWVWHYSQAYQMAARAGPYGPSDQFMYLERNHRDEPGKIDSTDRRVLRMYLYNFLDPRGKIISINSNCVLNLLNIHATHFRFLVGNIEGALPNEK